MEPVRKRRIQHQQNRVKSIKDETRKNFMNVAISYSSPLAKDSHKNVLSADNMVDRLTARFSALLGEKKLEEWGGGSRKTRATIR